MFYRTTKAWKEEEEEVRRSNNITWNNLIKKLNLAVTRTRNFLRLRNEGNEAVISEKSLSGRLLVFTSVKRCSFQ